MSRNFKFSRLALLVLIAGPLLLPCRHANGASLTRVTVTVTNTPVTSNVFYFSSSGGARLLRWTNQFTSTTIRTNLAGGTNGSTTNLFFAIVNYPTLGTFVRYASSNQIVLSGVSMVATQLGNWCDISSSTLSGTNQYDLALPFDTLPATNRTNNASELVYGIDTYSTNRTLHNFLLDPLNIQSLTVTGLFTTLAGQRVATHRVTNNFTLTTNQYWLGITPTSGPVKITLPAASTSSNQVWVIADEYGAAGTNMITVTNAGGDQIRGSLAVGISNNFGALILLSGGGTNFYAFRWNQPEGAGDITAGANLAPGAFTPFDSKSVTTLRFNSLTNGSGLSSVSNNNVVTLAVASDGISDAMLRNSAAVSVIGRSANSSGDPADIAAAANYRAMTREGDSLAFRQLTLTNYFSDFAWGPIADLDAIVWHAASGKWTNKPVTSTIDTLPELTDVADAFPGLANGDVLMYDSTSGKWTNAVPPGTGGGEANTGSNLGIGWPSYDSKSGVALRFNSWTNGAGLQSSSNANTFTMSLAPSISIDSSLTTNVAGRLRQLITSTATTNQIDWANGPAAYYWTNMVTNVVLQVTNVWTAGVTNRSLDFFFQGATNNGPNFTVLVTCPNPAGVNLRWGWNSTTNGNADLTVTNNRRAGLVLTMWETNEVEAYWSPVR